ncbi:hypothetical protein PQ472_12070 [Lacticaseibacillus pabuli]|uniref:Uncharacterized protein n=1 Tax=Lacticaseibacillus pabuli TaxID=3025672 RepID=A0ABY7WUG3_9LACO|nr:hypothetical protein [Lacticaseibacillus sp. KACC 23028]WDF82612.1 hypothetical protein PQ472_12070 [Lacticaseibacillus sp. KACC 23028]
MQTLNWKLRTRDVMFVLVLAVVVIWSKFAMPQMFDVITLICVVALFAYPFYLLVGAGLAIHRQRRRMNRQGK